MSNDKRKKNATICNSCIEIPQVLKFAPLTNCGIAVQVSFLEDASKCYEIVFSQEQHGWLWEQACNNFVVRGYNRENEFLYEQKDQTSVCGTLMCYFFTEQIKIKPDFSFYARANLHIIEVEGVHVRTGIKSSACFYHMPC